MMVGATVSMDRVLFVVIHLFIDLSTDSHVTQSRHSSVSVMRIEVIDRFMAE
jgi:hypothetical protein